MVREVCFRPLTCLTKVRCVHLRISSRYPSAQWEPKTNVLMACIWKVLIEVNVWKNALLFSHSIWWKHVTLYWRQIRGCQTQLPERPNCSCVCVSDSESVLSEASSYTHHSNTVITVTHHSDVSKVHGRIILENWCKLVHGVMFLWMVGLVFWLALLSLITVHVKHGISNGKVVG